MFTSSSSFFSSHNLNLNLPSSSLHISLKYSLINATVNNENKILNLTQTPGHQHGRWHNLILSWELSTSPETRVSIILFPVWLLTCISDLSRLLLVSITVLGQWDENLENILMQEEGNYFPVVYLVWISPNNRKLPAAPESDFLRQTNNENETKIWKYFCHLPWFSLELERVKRRKCFCSYSYCSPWILETEE